VSCVLGLRVLRPLSWRARAAPPCVCSGAPHGAWCARVRAHAYYTARGACVRALHVARVRGSGACGVRALHVALARVRGAGARGVARRGARGRGARGARRACWAHGARGARRAWWARGGRGARGARRAWWARGACGARRAARAARAVSGGCTAGYAPVTERLFILTLSTLYPNPAPIQMRGVVPPKSKEDAGLYLDMLEDLIASVKTLVNRALELSTAASTYGEPQDAAAQRALTRANRTALDAQKLAWERVHFAERNIVNKVTGMAAADIFLQFVSEDLNWDSQDYIVYLQGLVRRVLDERQIMEDNFPEKPSPILYALSSGGQRLKRSRVGAPGYDFDPVHLAWLADSPYGEFGSRRFYLQQEYGCGHSALDAAVRDYRINQARSEELFHGEDHEYRHNVVHYDSEGNVLAEEDEASIAEKVAKVRQSNHHLGRYNMVMELRRAYPNTYFSMYRIAKILATKDFSRRIWWNPVIIRTNIWSPYPFFSLHLDGNEKAIRAGVHVTGLVDACSGAVVMLQPLPAKRGELIAAEVISALCDVGGFVPRLLRCDKGSENTTICKIVDKFYGTNWYCGPSTRNQPVEQLWRDYSLNCSQEMQRAWDEFERKGLLDLDEGVHHLVCQAVSIKFLEAKGRFFLQRRDHMACGGGPTKYEKLKAGLAKAFAEGHLQRASNETWQTVYEDEMAACIEVGQAVVLGSEARLWGATAAAMQGTERWGFLQYSDINNLHDFIGDFSSPAPGVHADDYTVMFERFEKGLEYMRDLYSENSVDAPYF
jgi:hypothetical protein